jgi:hypothetical protein
MSRQYFVLVLKFASRPLVVAEQKCEAFEFKLPAHIVDCLTSRTTWRATPLGEPLKRTRLTATHGLFTTVMTTKWLPLLSILNN